jgi:hypothetical protein
MPARAWSRISRGLRVAAAVLVPLAALLFLLFGYRPSDAQVEADVRRCLPSCRPDGAWRSGGVFPTAEMKAASWCEPADLPAVIRFEYRWKAGRWRRVDERCW